MARHVPRRLRRLSKVEAAGVTVPSASGVVVRLLGLAFLERERAGQGLLIPHCRSVHTFGMRFALDLFFIDRDGLTVRIEREVPPGRVLFERSADRVLELPSTAR